MPFSAGPNIAARPNLVFEYDTGDVQNSYKGEPTTNLVNPSWTAWSVDGSGQGNIGTRTIISPYYCQISDNNANTRQYIYVEGISASTTYTFSVQYRSIAGAPTLRFQIQAYNGGSYISTMSFATTAQLGIVNNDSWQTAYITLTTPANTNRILWFMQDGDDYVTYTHAFELKNPQVEQKSHPTPFVVGTRSNTQGLLDVSGYGNILDLSTTSYDSNAQLVFDGTDDKIIGSTVVLPTANNSPMTLEAVAKTNNASGWQTVLGTSLSLRQIGFLNNNFYFGGNGGGGNSFVSGGTITAGQLYHIVMVYNGTTGYGYKNGVLVNSGNIGSNGNNNGVPLISTYTTGGGGEFLNGSVQVARVYNSALSAQEVLRNYNQLKGRFNLP